ncbi:MAG: efflux RND transporter permease subunit, partial [Rhizobiaceae bacterium]|nr:efflux RND transporter permease subunit [Rhizobiaceae bacterium]
VSNLSEGVSTTVVEFRLEVDTQEATNDVKDAIEGIKGEFPATAGEPSISALDVEGAAILTYAVSAPAKTLEELSWFVEDTVKRNLQGLKGVAQVSRFGGVDREIRVDLDPERVSALGVTAGDINNALRAANIDLTGGQGDIGTTTQSIRTLGQARSLADLQNLSFALPTGAKVRLGDVATVTDSWSEQKSFAKIGDRTVVAFAVFRAKGESDVAVMERVSAEVEALQAANPGVEILKVDDSVEYTYGNYESAMHTLLEGAFLAVLVVFLFLRDWRATLIAAAALPLSIIPTFLVLDLLGFSLNLVSLLGITLVTGILVDDVIVEIENIVRHMKMGKSPYRASIEAADEIGLAVVAISATIIAIFVPVSFMSGVAGQYFKQFGVTVAVAVFFSLLVARFITPMMTAYLMRDHHHEEPAPGLLSRVYVGLLRVAVRFRWVTLVLAGLFFYASLMATSLLPSGFIPKEDASRIVISMELPPGTPLDVTRAVSDEVDAALAGVPGIEQVYILGGSSATGSRDTRLGTITLDLVHKSEREISQSDIEVEVLARLRSVPDARFYFVNDRGDRELAIGVMGSDGAVLDEQARKIQSFMNQSGMFVAVSSNAALDKPELIVRPRQDKLAELGLNTADVSNALRVATLGDIDENLAKFPIGDRLVPIRVRLAETAREDIGAIRSLPVRTPAGASVPLESVADISFGQGPSTIQRFNRERRVVIGADMAPGFEIGPGLEAVKESDAVKNLPPGVRIQETGDAEVMGEIFASFAVAMVTGLMLVFVILILLLGSVFHTITILLSLPLSLGGVVAALWLTNNSISMPVVIGILMLMGIVTKNAIMLVDFAVERQKHGMHKNDAIIEAGRMRARPIIMTTIAMGAGMVPVALAIGDGGEFRAPMAIAVIGGLLVSTILSLVVVPALYSIMETVSRWVSTAFRWAVAPNAPDEPELILPSPHAAQPQLPPAQPKLASLPQAAE